MKHIMKPPGPPLEGVVSLIRLVVLPIGIIIDGFVLSKLWSWFMVTTFGLPPLTIFEAVGLAIVVQFFAWSMTRPPTNDLEVGDRMISAIVSPLIKAAAFLGVGWIFLQFI